MSGPIRMVLGPAKKRAVDLIQLDKPKYQADLFQDQSLDVQINQIDKVKTQLQGQHDKLVKALTFLRDKDTQWLNLIPTLDAAKQAHEEKLYEEAVTEKTGHLNVIAIGDDNLAEYETHISELETLKSSLQSEKVRLSLAESQRQVLESFRPAPHHPPSTSAASSSPATQQMKLPKLELPTFDGNPLKWTAFWDVWKASVHRQDIADVQKLSYLLPKLTGVAAASVQGLAINNTNYRVAIQILEDRFGQPEMVKNTILSKLRNLRISDSSVKGLRSTLSAIEVNLRQLESMGEDIDQPVLADLLRSKIPADILTEMQRSKNLTDQWTVGFIRTTLLQIIQEKEEIQRLTSQPSTQSKTKPDQNFKPKSSPSTSTDQKQPTISTGTLSAASNSNTGNRSKQQRQQQPQQQRQVQQQQGGQVQPKSPCVFCDKMGHFNDRCQEFITLPARKAALAKRKDPIVCFKCLRRKHTAKDCTTTIKCFHCKSDKHMGALCPQKLGGQRRQSEPSGNATGQASAPVQETSDSQSTPSTSQATTQVQQVQQVTNASHVVSNHSANIMVKSSMLMTATSVVRNPEDPSRSASVQLFFDPGAQRTFIKDSVVKKLQLSKQADQELLIYAFGSQKPQRKVSQYVVLDILLRDGSVFTIEADSLAHLTTKQVRNPLSSEDKAYIQNSIPEPFFADHLPFEASPFDPDIIIGEDYFWTFILDTPRTQLPSGLFLIPSKLGLLLGGKQLVTATQSDSGHHLLQVQCLMNQALDNLNQFDSTDSTTNPPNLEDFWALERIGIQDNPVENEDDDAIGQFNDTIQFSMGRYYVKWPYNDNIKDLPTNRKLALKRFKSLSKRFQQEPDLLPKYSKIISDQVDLGIIEPVHCSVQANHEDSHPDGRKFHYLPHHPVITPQKTTTKVRIVYDGSARTRTTQSINDCLHRGQVILPDLCGLLLRFRLFPIAILADIEKAFLQIGLQDADRDLTRFWWYKDPTNSDPKEDNLQIYRFCRVPFGIISSPFLLAATVKYHLSRYESDIANQILQNIYVDNVILGVNSTDQGLQLYHESKHMFQEASMNLREWTSNDQNLIKQLPMKDQVNQQVVKVLGLIWQLDTDVLLTTLPKVPSGPLTKRNFCQLIASIFDPLGFMTPATLAGKLFFQNLWTLSLDWDDSIPDNLHSQVDQIIHDLQQLHSIQLPRFIGCQRDSCAELHVFIDSSAAAYAAAVYLRQPSDGANSFKVNLIFSKVRLTPKQPKVTIPRLELLSMVIGCRALHFCLKQLHIPISATFVWSDSQCCLQWLTTKRPLAKFVHNRFSEIHTLQTHLPNCSFHFVETKSNPADVATRGSTVHDLKNHPLWWHGPPWFSTDSWPQHHFPPITQEKLDEVENELSKTKPIPLHSFPAAVKSEKSGIPNPMDIPMDKFSSLSRLLRTTVFAMRFIQNISKGKISLSKDILSKGPILSRELKAAKHYWDSAVQDFCFEDIQQKLDSMPSSNQLINSLGLFKDSSGLIRCSGRFQNANVFSEDFPVLLPKSSHYTSLIVQHCHSLVHHSGLQQTLAKLRQQYWIPNGRAVVKQILHKCQICRKVQGKPYPLPPMAPLPNTRTSKASPFTYTGLDYLGPIWYKAPDGTKLKSWVCLFTCLITRAVHLELATDMTAQMFLNCLRRFIARRGVPKKILSDNAAQFLLARSAIDKQWQTLIHDPEVISFCSTQGPEWKTTTPMAPWQGGAYERLVALVKSSFKKTIGRKMLTQEQLITFLTEIEAVINCRPLTYAYEDSAQVLRPIDFLLPFGSLGTPSFPEAEDEAKDPSYVPQMDSTAKLTKFWESTQTELEKFWKFWQEEYLLYLMETHQSINKRYFTTSPPSKNDVVLIYEPNLPRGQWKMGRIHELHPSSDGHIRSATVSLPNHSTLLRPINHLYPLEFASSPSLHPHSPSSSTSGAQTSTSTYSILHSYSSLLKPIFLLFLFASFHLTSSFSTPSRIYQLCSRGRSGHAIAIPKIFSCRLPENKPIQKTMVELWTQRDIPQKTTAYHCYIQIHTIITRTSFILGKGLLADITDYQMVAADLCNTVIESKIWNGHVLHELSPGFWSTNQTLQVQYKWCCYDVKTSTINFIVEEGEIASLDGKRLVSDLQDMSACVATAGHCQNQDMGTTVWNGSFFMGQCSFKNHGKFIATISGNSLVISKIQGAFSYSGHARIPGSECVPPSSFYADQGAVYIHFLNQTPSSWLELLNHAQEMPDDLPTDDIDLTNYKRFFLYKRMLQIESREFSLIWHQLCSIKQTLLNHVWQLLRIDPSLGIRAFLGKANLHAEWAGEALIFWECRNVTPSIIHWSGKINGTCYKYTPVKLVSDGPIYFVSPGSSDLVTDSPTIECSHAPPHYFQGEDGQWHSSSGPVHVTTVPLELTWKGLWDTFTFKAPSLFSNQLGHLSNFMDVQHQIFKFIKMDRALNRLINYTAEMSLDPAVIQSTLSGMGEGMAHVIEGNAKALGHLVTDAAHGIGDLASSLLKGPLQFILNILVIIIIFVGILFLCYVYVRYRWNRGKSIIPFKSRKSIRPSQSTGVIPIRKDRATHSSQKTHSEIIEMELIQGLTESIKSALPSTQAYSAKYF